MPERRAGRIHVTPIAAALAAAALACSGGTDDVEWLGTREWIDSVEVVRNPGAPMLPPGAARAERLWSTPADTAPSEHPDSLWQAAAALTVAGDRVFVLDRMAHRIYGVRASDGTWESTWGRQGRGPGELASPLDIMMLGPNVAVLDGGQASIVQFAMDGSPLDPIRLPSVTFSAFPLDSTRVMVGGMQGTLILRAGSEPQPVEFEEPVALPEGPGTSCQPFGRLADAIARWSCVVPHVQILDTLGRAVREILLGLEPTRTDEARLEAFIARARQRYESTNMSGEEIAQLTARTRDSYTFSRRWRRLQRDPITGMLAFWEQSPSEIAPGPATLHLLRPDGAWLASIPFDRPWAAFAINDDTVYALERDPDTDLASLAAYRILLA